MRKYVFLTFLIGILIGTSFLNFDLVECNPSDWNSAEHEYRIKMLFKGDDFVNENVFNLPVSINLSNIDLYWNYRNNSGSNEIRIFGPEEDGGNYGDMVELYYEVLHFDAVAEEFVLYVNLPFVKASSGSSPSNYVEFYIYFDYDGVDTFDNPLELWSTTNASFIYNAVNENASYPDISSSGLNYADFISEGIGYGSFEHDGSTGYDYCLMFDGIDACELKFNPYNNTILVWKYGDYESVDVFPTSYSSYMRTGLADFTYNSVNSFSLTLDINNLMKIYRPFRIPVESDRNRMTNFMADANESYIYHDTNWSIDSYVDIGTAGGGGDNYLIDGWNMIGARYNTYGTTVDYFINTDIYYRDWISITFTTPTQNFYVCYNYIHLIDGLGAIKAISGDVNGYYSNIWIFNDAKSDAWLNLIYNNSVNYNNTITVSELQIDEYIPEIIYPEHETVFTTPYPSISWFIVEDMDYYNLQVTKHDDDYSNAIVDVNVDGVAYSLITPLEPHVFYKARVRAYDGVYSTWSNDVYFVYSPELQFINIESGINNIPIIADFEIQFLPFHEDYEYHLEISEDDFATTVYNVSNIEYPNYPEFTFSEFITYYMRVRGVNVDNVYATYETQWSDTLVFAMALDYDFSFDNTNIYAGETFTYYFAGLSDLYPEGDYTFLINRIDQNGNFVETIATKIVTEDATLGNFTHTFTANSDFPFEVRDADLDVRLSTHYVKPYPNNLYNLQDHRNIDNGDIIAVSIGDVTYNSLTDGVLHNTTLPNQSVYTETEYFILYYGISDYSLYEIEIRNMDTGQLYLTLNSDDLLNYNDNPESFILIPIDGVRPSIVSNELDSFDGDNWHEVSFSKGAYDYAVIEITPANGPKNAIGESVLLIGNESNEWTMSKARSSLTEGQRQTWSLYIETAEIWNTYNLMYFLDRSSNEFKIGSIFAYEQYPQTYIRYNTLEYTINTNFDTVGGARWGFRPDSYNFNANTEYDIWYNYYIEDTFTINPLVDRTEMFTDLLVTIGLGSVQGKILVAMSAIIVAIMGGALVGIPVAILSLIALSLFVIFITMGYLPLWTVVIVGLAFFILMMRIFFRGGGNNE